MLIIYKIDSILLTSNNKMSDSHIVYKIERCGAASGTHAVGRTETWIISPDTAFDSPEAATAYARDQTRKLPEFIILTERLSKELIEVFLTEFMTNDLYLTKNQFFVGYPPVKRIQTLLKLSGVKIETRDN
jgi:hypothetical protein